MKVPRDISASDLIRAPRVLGDVLKPVAAHHKLTVEELLAKLEL